MNIKKRSGKIENLTKKKIFNSILKANESVSEEERLTQTQIRRISDAVYTACEDLNSQEPIDIDFVENKIEEKLFEASGYAVGRQYIKYRYEKERNRKFKALTEKLMAKNVQNQNANVDEASFGGRIGETASHVMKDFALNHMMSKRSRENHENNEIYIHDLDHYAIGDQNCLSIPFDDLLANGFSTRQVDIRPAKSVSTALQLIAVIFQIQSLQQFGGVAATHIDVTLVPYVRLSFWRHFKKGLKYVEGLSDDEIAEFERQLEAEGKA